MYTSSLLVAVAAFAGLAAAQNLDGAVFNGQNYSVSGPIAVPPQNIDIGTKRTICLAETQQCPQICGGLASNNTCDVNTLQWNCTCSNGNQPNISDYQQTVPGLVCRIWQTNCVNAFPNDANGQAGCHSVHCGNKTVNSASTTTASSTSSSATGGSTSSPASGGAGANTATATTSTARGAATALAVAQQYGNIVVAGGMAALLGLAL